MLNEPPTFEVVGDGELSDSAIEALATLLLDAADRAARRDELPPPPPDPPASRPAKPKRRRRVPSKEAQRPAK